MEWLSRFTDSIISFDQHFSEFLQQYGMWSYLVLFLIIFAETGLVIAPFLPGDTLLFVAGVFALKEGNGLNIWLLFFVLVIAAVMGNTANYHIARLFESKFLEKLKSPKIHKHLKGTHDLFEKYGGWAIIIARFIPFARTLAPFVAGIGRYSYGAFQLYNILGAILWVGACVFLGYFAGRVVEAHSFTKFIPVILIAAIILPFLLKYGLGLIKSIKKPSSLE